MHLWPLVERRKDHHGRRKTDHLACFVSVRREEGFRIPEAGINVDVTNGRIVPTRPPERMGRKGRDDRTCRACKVESLDDDF